METLAYLIKVNVAIILLYGFYRLLFQKDTFFKCKRILLLSILLVSLLYPFWDISRELMKSEQFNEAVKNGVIFPSYYLNEVVITAQNNSTGFFSWENLFSNSVTIIYSLVTVALLCWMVMQIIGIIMKIRQSTIDSILGRRVYINKNINTPFSFFRWIVLNPATHNENEIKEILLHEQTHVHQWHSIDTIVCELMCAFCWFNPFIWLMKREIRMNLEYLADRSVLNSGCDTEHYQFHLLRLSYSKAAAKLSNNFNVSPLKKRILMMNKKQTPLLGLAKYLFFLPLMGFLLVVNSMEAINSEDLKPKALSVIGIDKSSLHVQIDSVYVTCSDEPPLRKQAEVASVTGIAEKTSSPRQLEVVSVVGVSESTQKKTDEGKTEVYSHVQQMPHFPGGEKALMEYIASNIVYPEDAVKNDIQGRVLARFVVNENGKIQDVEIVRSLIQSCDEEVVRVLEAMPKWIPGKQNGKDVSVYYTLPVGFKMQKKDKGESLPKKDIADLYETKDQADLLPEKDIADLYETKDQVDLDDKN